MSIFRPKITFHKPDPVKDKEFHVVLDSGVTSADVTLAGSSLPIVKELEFKYEAVDVNPSSQILEYMSYTEIYNVLLQVANGGSTYRLDYKLDIPSKLKPREGLQGVYKNTLKSEVQFDADDVPVTCTLELSTSGIWTDKVQDPVENQWYRSIDYSSYTQTLPAVMDFPKDLEMPYGAKDKVYCRYTYSVWYKDTKSNTLKFKALYRSKTFELDISFPSVNTRTVDDPVNELQARLRKLDEKSVASVIRPVDYSFKAKVNQSFNMGDSILVKGEEGDYTLNVDFKLELNSRVSYDMFLSNLEGISITSEDPSIIISKDTGNININSRLGCLEVNDVTLIFTNVKKEIVLNVEYKSVNGNDNKAKVIIRPEYPVKPKEILALNTDNLLHGTEEFLKLRDDVPGAYVGFRNIFYFNDMPAKTVRSTWEVLDNGIVIYSLDNTLIPSTLGIFTHNSFRRGTYNSPEDKETLKKLSLIFPNVKFEKESLTEDEIEEYLSSDVYKGLPYGSSIFTKRSYTMCVTFYNKDNEPLGRVEKDFNLDNIYLKSHTNRTDLYSLNCYKLPFLSKDKYFKYYKKFKDYKCCRPINSLLVKSQSLYHEDSYIMCMGLMFRDKDPENIDNLYLASPVYYESRQNASNRTFTIFKNLDHLAEMIHSMSYFEDPVLGEIRRPISITLGITGDYFKARYVSEVKDTVESVKEELIKLGVLEVVEKSDLDTDKRFITVSVYPSEDVISYPLYMETIPYVLEEELSRDSELKKTDKYYSVKCDTKELKIFKDNFEFLDLVLYDKLTDLSLTGFKGVHVPNTLYYKGQEVMHPKDYSLYLCIRDTEVDTPITDGDYFRKVCDSDKVSSLPTLLDRYYGEQLPSFIALCSYFNVINTKGTILSNFEDYKVENFLDYHVRQMRKAKVLGKDLQFEGSIEKYSNILGYWFKLKNLNNHSTIYYSSKPVFWCKDKTTVVKLGLTHPRNNLIRVGLKYYYARLVTDVYNPSDDCCVESNVISGIPNNDIDFTSFNDPTLVNAKESIITYDILKALVDSTDLKEENKEILKSHFDVLSKKSDKTNLVYSALPKDKDGNRYLDNGNNLDYNIHMVEELYYGGELSEELFGMELPRVYNKEDIESTPYNDYYPVHMVLEEVEEKDLPIYNLKKEIKQLVGEFGINTPSLEMLAKDKYNRELNGYDVHNHSLFPTLDPVNETVTIPTILHGGYVNNVNLIPDGDSIRRASSPSYLSIPSYDRWSMTGYLGMLRILPLRSNPIFSQLEKIAKHRLKNNDVVREEENSKQPIVHAYYFKGKVYLIPTDQPFITDDEFIRFGRPKPLDSFSKDVERVKIGNLIFDVELLYLLNNKGV